MNNSGLSDQEILGIKKVFTNYPNIEEAILYGSRAMGNYKPASDIDITLIGKELDLSLLNQIEFELDDLMLPYKFDVSIYHKISNQDLIKHIKRVGKKIYEKQEFQNAV